MPTPTPLPRRTLLLSALAGTLPSARAETPWPTHPIRWVIAYPPGGGQDFLARQLAPPLAQRLGQPVVIDNRPGAAGIIGTEVAAKAPADGHTIVTGDNGALVFNPALYRKLPYAVGDFVPLGLMARFPLILVAAPASGFTDVRQWLAAVRRAPGATSYASPGTGSPHHLAMELIKERTGSFIVHVPYRGTAMATQDVMSGQVPVTIVDTAGGLGAIRAGRLRALAVLTPQRIPSLPDVPTLAESGVPGFEAVAWQGLFAPRGTPPDIVERLSAAMRAAIVVPEVRARLEEFGLEVAPGDGPALARQIERETAFWHRLIRERRLAIEQ